MKFDSKRLYGFFLASTNIVTLIFWRVFDFQFGLLDKLQNPSGNPWSFMPSWYIPFIQDSATGLVIAYIALSFLAPLIFLISKIPLKAGIAFLALAFCLKLSIFFSSYDFMGNYHYMNNLVTAGYILTAGNLFLAQIMLAFFYFGAGLIKLNWEWISGSALLVETFLPKPLLIAACIYVIVLELVLIWGLFSNNRKIKNLTLLQLFIFHIFSWHIVGFYYPVIMIMLLTVFLVYPAEGIPSSQFSKWLQGKGPAWIYVYVAIFLAAQFYPKILNKNEAVTAEGRLFSLNMLDAKAECLASYEIETDLGYLYLDQHLKFSIRVRCDPLVYFNYGKNLCADLPESKKRSVKLNLKAKKSSDDKMIWTVRDQELCSDNLNYSVWSNDWIYSTDRILEKNSIANDKSKATKHWRQNPARTGETDAHVSLNSKASTLPLPLHSGIHLAAKSSPLFHEGYWVVGGDNGWLWGFEGPKKIWSSYFPGANYGFHGTAASTNDGNFVIGSYDGILHKVNSKTGQRLWAEKLASAIGSSPLVLNSQIFIATELLPDQSLFFALDSENGQVLWKTSAYMGLAHASLAFDQKNGLLFGATNSGLLIALSKEDGKEQWQHQLEGKIISTPLVANDKVFVISTTGKLSAYNAKDGLLVWSKNLDSGSRASPSYSTKYDLLIVPLEDGRIFALNAGNGSQAWSYSNPHLHVSSGLITQNLESPIYWDLCAEKTLCAFEVTSGQILKKFTLPGTFSSTPEVSGNGLIITLDDEAGVWFLGNEP